MVNASRRRRNVARSTRKRGLIGPLHKGDLAQFGYEKVVTMSEGRRHLALAGAVRKYGALGVWRKLNAVYVYTKNGAPTSSAIFKADRDWVKSHYKV